ERPVPESGAGQVRIRVEACGICHTDAATVTGIYPGLTLPRVPGHEVVGRIEALGSGVSKWKIGQRVGVGFFGGEDGVCEPCRRGDIVNCHNPVIAGVTVDGGYAEVMIAEARGIASIPDELTSVEAAPLLCAGGPILQSLRVLPKYSKIWRLRSSTSPAALKVHTNPGMVSTIRRNVSLLTSSFVRLSMETISSVSPRGSKQG